jgi:hypothetical protein
MMDTLPVVQNFFGKPVRFFKADFWVEEHCRNDNAPPMNFMLETWAIPLPDYAKAIGYGVEHIWRIIQRSDETFAGFYRHAAYIYAIQHITGSLETISRFAEAEGARVISGEEVRKLAIGKLDDAIAEMQRLKKEFKGIKR